MEWVSGDPGVRITGAYGCGYEGQTYSGLISWILVPTETSVPPAALDPHSLSVPPCLPVCYSVCVLMRRLTWADWRRWLSPDG